jgi:hypothetical protein
MTKLLVVHLPPFHLRRKKKEIDGPYSISPPPTELCVFGGYKDI